jgi:hypothetical protein
VSELLKRQNVSVDVEGDVVVLRVSDQVARFSYYSAFRIAQRLRLSAGVAARTAGVNQEERSDMKRQAAPESFLADVRVEEAELAGLTWDAWAEGELVAFKFGNTIARWEADAAMTIAAWFREGGRQAKAWAGDTSQILNVSGILTDANANARQ